MNWKTKQTHEDLKLEIDTLISEINACNEEDTNSIIKLHKQLDDTMSYARKIGMSYTMEEIV